MVIKKLLSAEWLESVVTELPVESLSDSDALHLTQLQPSDEQQSALSELLERNRENGLDEQGRRHLDELMRVYEHGLLRKAQALRIAVQRGLLAPLQACVPPMSLTQCALECERLRAIAAVTARVRSGS